MTTEKAAKADPHNAKEDQRAQACPGLFVVRTKKDPGFLTSLGPLPNVHSCTIALAQILIGAKRLSLFHLPLSRLRSAWHSSALFPWCHNREG